MKKFIILFLSLTCAIICANWLNSPISALLNGFFHALTPLLIGIVIAYFLNHAVKFFEKIFASSIKRENTRRLLSVILGISAVIIAISVILVLCLPAVIDNVNALIQNLPEYIEKLKGIAKEVDGAIGLQGDLSLYTLVNSFDISTVSNYFSSIAQDVLPVVSNLAISLLLSVLILLEKDNIMTALKKFVDKVFRSPERVKEGAGCIVVILDGYVVGKLMEALITGGVFTITYFIFGIAYAPLFGFLMGILFLIPYIGGYIALTLPTLVLLNTSPSSALLLIIVGVVILNVIGSIVSPMIFQNKLKVSALTMTASIIVGGSAFGIVGFLLAPPVVATFKAFFSVFINSKPNKYA